MLFKKFFLSLLVLMWNFCFGFPSEYDSVLQKITIAFLINKQLNKKTANQFIYI